jgi:4a-hydroxytetrahydrobiopterin dehydratase
MTTLENQHCLPCEGLGSTLNTQTIQHHLHQLTENWQLSSDNKMIFYDFKFKNYYHVIAFVNALAWIAHHENHHPDLEIGFNHCLVRYSTHALGGLTENDFICAAKVDALFQPYVEKQNDRK